MLSNVRALAGMCAGAIAIASFIPYARSIRRGATRPNWISWAVWTVLGIVLFASYWASGASDTLWIAFAYCFNPLAVCLLAYRYGFSRIEPLDWLCLGGAIVSLLVWRVSHNPAAALYCAVATDGFGALPTIRKAYADPVSEDALAWRLTFLGSLLNLVAIDSWTPSRCIYPLYLVLCTGIIAGLLSWRRLMRFALRAR